MQNKALANSESPEGPGDEAVDVPALVVVEIGSHCTFEMFNKFITTLVLLQRVICDVNVSAH